MLKSLRGEGTGRRLFSDAHNLYVFLGSSKTRTISRNYRILGSNKGQEKIKAGKKCMYKVFPYPAQELSNHVSFAH